MDQVRSFIDGQFVNPVSDEWFERVSPVTGEAVTRVPDSDVLDLVRAVQAANKAWTVLQKMDPTTRKAEAKEFCRRLANAFSASADELAILQSEETGTAIGASRASVASAVAELEHFSRRADNVAAVSERDARGDLAHGHRLPIGVVALILPAYEPVTSLVRRLAPALAAGNVVIAKASSFAPRTYECMARAVQNSGVSTGPSSGVFSLLQGRGARVGRAIVEHPGLSTITFAGRTETGRLVQQGAAELLKRTQLSLGGCNPALVFDGVDLEQIAERVIDLSLSTQTPAPYRAARIFVQAPIYEKFLEALRGAAAKIKVGDAREPATTLGPVIRADEKKRFVESVAQAVRERGKILELAHGKLPERGNFVAPTAVYDVSLCSTLQQEEIIGPLAMIESFKYQHDAIKHANNSPFGQVAYVFHADREKGAQIAARIEAGRVIVNPDAQAVLPHTGLSFGGLKASGFGREGGEDALDFFSRQTKVEISAR